MAEFREKIKESKVNTKQRLITSKIQHLVLKKLFGTHSKVKKILLESHVPIKNFEEEYLKLMERTKTSEFLSDDFRKRNLVALLHQERIKHTLANKLNNKSASILEKFCKTLDILKGAVNSALMINETPVEGHLEDMDLTSLATHLLKIIDKCFPKELDLDSQSVETVADAAAAYAVGDLGFEPEHIELEDQIDEVYSTPIESTSMILKELEGLQEDLPDERSPSHKSSKVTTSTETSMKSEGDLFKKSIDVDKNKEVVSLLGSYDSYMEHEMEDEYDYIDYTQE